MVDQSPAQKALVKLGLTRPIAPPAAALSAFGADGLEFTVAYWIHFPESGKPAIRSAVNLAILQALRSNGIDIPFPQRVVHAPKAR